MPCVSFRCSVSNLIKCKHVFFHSTRSILVSAASPGDYPQSLSSLRVDKSADSPGRRDERHCGTPVVVVGTSRCRLRGDGDAVDNGI